MKKMILVIAVAVLAVPALAWSGDFSAPNGKYKGSIVSTSKDLNGKTATLELNNTGDKVVANVTFEDSKENWTWDGKNLEQKEFDLKTGKEVNKYLATSAKPAANNEQTYNIRCTDAAKKTCDAGVDSRSYWTIKTAPDTLTYQYYGVPKDKLADLAAKPEKKIDIAFKLAK